MNTQVSRWLEIQAHNVVALSAAIQDAGGDPRIVLREIHPFLETLARNGIYLTAKYLNGHDPEPNGN